MSNKRALVHFKEIRVERSELKNCSDDAVAIYGVTSYAITESHVMARIVLASLHSEQPDDEINVAAFIHYLAVLRVWVAKLFEYHEMLDNVSKTGGCKDVAVINLAKHCLNDFATLRADKGYELARDVRHETASHYSIKAAKKNIQYLGKTYENRIFLSEKASNSFYPFGEELMFSARLNRFANGRFDTSSRSQFVTDLFAWCKLANGWLAKCHAQIFQELISPHIKKKVFKRQSYWVDSRLVGDTPTDFCVPVFAGRDLAP